MQHRIDRLDTRNSHVRELMRTRRQLVAEFDALYEMSWIHHDNALEGIVLTGPEMKAALSPTKVIPNDTSTAATFAEIRNHKAAIEVIRAEAASPRRGGITLAFIKQLHEVLCQNFEGREEPLFRKEMPLHRTYFHEIAQPPKIGPMLDKVLEYTATTEFRETHPIRQVGRFHHGFMQAFPYTESSGKIARLVSNLLLMRGGFLPVIIPAVDRQRYYDALRHQPQNLVNLYVEAMENTVENATRFLEAPKLLRVS